MKLSELFNNNKLRAIMLAAMIMITAVTPMQAMAYTKDQVGNLNSQPKVESTLNFNDNQKVPVTLNGLPTNLKTPAYVTGGRTLLPIRGAAELLNAEVNFQPNGEPGLIQITKDANEVLLQLGRNKLIKNGTMTAIDSSNPKIGAATFKGTTYLPLRAVASALGVEVEYKSGRVNIITEAVEPIIEANGYKLVPNTNPELITTMMDANSKEIKGDLWTVPQGLIYKNPDGLKPGDKLTNEQKDRLLIHFKGFSQKAKDAIHAKDYIYLPPGTKLALDDDDDSWIYNDISYQGTVGYGFRAAKGSKALSPRGAWDGIVAFKDGSYGSFDSATCDRIVLMGLDKVNYAIYDTGTDYSYVTFYNQ